jgi:hypothetical protein
MFENNYEYAQHAELANRFRSGANWFYWIAGLTLLTSVISLMGGGWSFFLSLGITQLIDGFAVYFADSFGEATKVVAIVLDIFITALFIGLGYLSNQRQLWAFLAGIILFGFDSLLSLVIFNVLGLIIHCVVMFLMIRGYIAGRDLLALERELTAATASAQTVSAPQPTF